MTRLSPEDSALDAWLLCTRNTRLPFVERQIASLPDDNPNKPELQKYMRRVREAHAKGDADLLRTSIDLLMVSVKAAVFTIPFAITGESHKQAQRERASKPRGGIGETIKELAEQKDVLGDWIAPKELWGELFAILDEGASTREGVTAKGDLEISYKTERGATRTIKFKSFQSAVSRYRTKS